jgi:hypothetical protein
MVTLAKMAQSHSSAADMQPDSENFSLVILYAFPDSIPAKVTHMPWFMAKNTSNMQRSLLSL